MTKVPWRGQETSSEVFVATKVGQCVSVDQLVSTQVDFIAQLVKGTLTKKGYTAATVFVDHYSWLKYVHLMTKLTSKETMDAKQAFEHFAKQHGVRILHYHCNNGRFADNAFKNSCSNKGQQLTFWGSMPTSKMALQRKPSEISGRVHGSNSSMHANAGLPPSTWPSGLMHSGVLSASTIPYLFWRMEPQR
jgi:hypothetical protein